jgi:hypothetical protein
MPTPIDPADPATDLYTLSEIAARGELDEVVIRRLARERSGRIPVAGSDPERRYPPAAIEVFRRLAREEEERRTATPWHRRPLLTLSAQLRASQREPTTRVDGGTAKGADAGAKASQSAQVASAVASAAGGRFAQRPEPETPAAPPPVAPEAAGGRFPVAAPPLPPGLPAGEAAVPRTSDRAPRPRLVASDGHLASPASAGVTAAADPADLPSERPRRGRPPGQRGPASADGAAARLPQQPSPLAGRLQALEASQARLEADIREVLASLREPLRGSVAEI